MSLLTETLNRYIQAIASGNPVTISGETILLAYQKKYALFKHDFFKTPINDPELSPLIQELLVCHQVPKQLHGRYNNARISLFQLLTELNALDGITLQHKRELKQLIEAINKKQKLPWWMLLGLGLLFLAIMLGLSSSIIYAGGLSVLQQLVAAALFFPICGLIFSISVAIFLLIQKNGEKDLTRMQRFRENFFLLANASLNIAAYSVLISAAATTPLGAGLFILATVVNVVKEAVALYYQPKHQFIAKPEDNLPFRQQEARELAFYKQHRNALVINLCSAILLATAISLWCLIPATMFVNIAAIAIIGLVHLTTLISQRVNEKQAHQGLIKRFETLEKPYQASRVPIESVATEKHHSERDEDHATRPAVEATNTAAKTLQQFGFFGRSDNGHTDNLFSPDASFQAPSPI